MIALIKTNMRLLFRTKAFWFFLLLMPALSTLILNVKFDSSAAYIDDFSEEIKEIDGADQKMAYYGGKGEYVVKVYDACHDKLSEALLTRLAKSGLFLICRVDITGESIGDMKEYMDFRIEKDGYQDRMGAVLLITPDFSKRIMEGNGTEALKMYILSDDERCEALQTEIELQLSEMEGLKKQGLEGSDDLADAMAKTDEYMPEKNLVTVAGTNGRSLTVQQTNQKSQMGYAFAFMTLGFVFCGIFVAHTSIKEQKNGVFTRINLTGTSMLRYFVSKFVSVFFVSVMITAVVAICSFLLSEEDLGMSRIKYIGMIFLMGLIFSSLSMMIGILLGDVMSSNVAAFTIWCMSALLSGLYFPLNYTSNALKALSFMMPQKWFLEATEMIFVKDNSVYLMLICVTVAYLALIISLGGLGLKIRRTEAWGNS